MKNIVTALLFALLTCNVVAQNIDVAEVKNSGEYLWGEGNGSTINKADKEALSALVSQLSVAIEVGFEQHSEETDDEFHERVQSIVKTYSSAKLANTQRIVVSDEPNAKVIRYISKSEVAKQYENRRKKILQYVVDAEKAEDNVQISDALRFYYWALCLLNSYPYSDTIHHYNGDILKTYIPKRINGIFGGLAAYIGEVEKETNKQNVELLITYNNKPVQNYDYTYFDGQNYSNIVSAKDGRGIIELSAMHDLKDIRLRSEYAFESEAMLDDDLMQVFEEMEEEIPFHNNKILVQNNKNKETKALLAKKNEEHKTNEQAVFEPIADTIGYLDIIKALEQAIRTKNYTSVKQHFTPEGYSMFDALMNYGNAKLMTNNGYSFYSADGCVICRSMPIRFSFKGNKTFVESIVYEFDENRKIKSLSFQLEQEAIADISNKTRWSKEAKHVLVRFLENYKTAYALERKDYLNQIFSDDALIIVGSVVKKPTALDKQVVLLNDKQVEFNRYTKAEYIKNLERCFARNEFINLRFTENDIKKVSNDKEVYGIQIKQDYFSSTYGDSGYLFLAVDLEVSDKPVIHVRTWQPERDEEGNIFSIVDFDWE